MAKIKCVFIGEEFYTKSKMRMSSIYTEKGSRIDLGIIQKYLENGDTVIIRPPTEAELGHYARLLLRYI
jgi:hypothetical protein